MITLPDIRQTGDYDCGSACVDTVLRFFGVRSCASVLRMSNPVQGTSPDTVEAMLRSAGLSIVSGTMNLRDLKHFSASGHPILCPVTTRTDGGHWVVVAGVERLQVYYQDPLTGPMKMGSKEWVLRWSDSTRTKVYEHWGIAVGG